MTTKDLIHFLENPTYTNRKFESTCGDYVYTLTYTSQVINGFVFLHNIHWSVLRVCKDGMNVAWVSPFLLIKEAIKNLKRDRFTNCLWAMTDLGGIK